MITVKSALSGNRVALWQVHPDHPGGEVFVVGDKGVKVAETDAVKEAIKDGKLVQVGKRSGK